MQGDKSAALHPEFLDTASGPVGRIVTSEEYPATAHEFYFWTSEDEAARSLDIGHIVAAEAEDATAVAVLDDPRRYSDLQSFLDDFYARDGDAAFDALTDSVEILVFRARVLATRHRDPSKKSRRPVKSGPVYFATAGAIGFALGTDEFEGTRIPMLLHENGNETEGVPQRTPLYADADYLLGPEAGHLNITGMSGLSTKTSHALFTISSIFQTDSDKKVAALMFNVKGADLLFLDKSTEPPEDDPDLAARYEAAGQRGLPEDERRMYEALGLQMKPFENLSIFAPLSYRGSVKSERVVHPQDFSARDLSTRRRAYGEDQCVHPVVWDLGDILPHVGRVFDPTDYDDRFRGFVEYLRREQVYTMREFYARTDEALQDMEENGQDRWRGHHIATIMKARNRFNTLPSTCQGMLVDGKVDYSNSRSADEKFTDREMRVVDISHLTGIPQDIAVTKIIQSIWEKAEQGLEALGVDKLIIFVDELNKYAPAGSKTSSLKDTLVDISARGRHLNLTLFGAQQFRSKVDDEVVGNAATSVYGRIGDEEITNSSYRSFSKTTHDELLQLEKGRLLLRHAHYAVPVFGRFPRPPVLMGKQGTDIFGEQRQEPAQAVLSVMRNLMKSPPRIQEIRAEIEGIEPDRVHEKLDAVQAACRSGQGPGDPYKNFLWNVKSRERKTNGQRDNSQIMSGLNRMRD